jgi:hypothetical protein
MAASQTMDAAGAAATAASPKCFRASTNASVGLLIAVSMLSVRAARSARRGEEAHRARARPPVHLRGEERPSSHVALL